MKKVLFVLALVAVASVATAQSAGKYGVNLQYSGGANEIALTYHISDALALRPVVGFNSADNGTNTTTTYAVGSDVLYYLSNADGMGTYVGGRFKYAGSSTDTDPETSSSTLTFGGLLGFQYALNAKLAVYGDVSFGYNAVSTEVNKTTTDSSTMGLNSTGVGLIFYLN